MLLAYHLDLGYWCEDKKHFFSSLQEISLLFLTSLMSKEKNAQILESRISKLFFFFIN